MAAFFFASTPHVHFGNGKLSVLPEVIRTFGSNVLLITGARSFISSNAGVAMLERLHTQKFTVQHYTIDREPTPMMIDKAVEQYGKSVPHVVVAIGGGSVLDAGKAIAAMLPLHEGVKVYLEGVGKKLHPGVKVPFI